MKSLPMPLKILAACLLCLAIAAGIGLIISYLTN